MVAGDPPLVMSASMSSSSTPSCFRDPRRRHDAYEWRLAHSVLSSSLNLGCFIPPKSSRRPRTPTTRGLALNAVEGFIRQVIGWREYIRGIYWMWGSDYADSNALDARAPPTRSHRRRHDRDGGVAHTTETLHDKAVHHIERLMVLGNLALTTGTDPQVDSVDAGHLHRRG